MINLREEVEKILTQVLMKHHDDISKQDDDAIAEATDQILQVIHIEEFKDLVKKVRTYADIGGRQFNQDEEEFWVMCEANDKAEACLAQIRERIRGDKANP